MLQQSHTVIVLATQEHNKGYYGSCEPGSVVGKQNVYTILSQGDKRVVRGWLMAFAVISRGEEVVNSGRREQEKAWRQAIVTG